MSRFPDCFPPDFEENILRDKGEFVAHHGYRLAEYGREDPRSYMGWYEEKLLSPMPLEFSEEELNDVGIYGTSLFDNCEYVQYLADVKFFPPPGAAVVEGFTVPCCGPSRQGKKRKRDGYKVRHINWWIYKDKTPWKYFEEVEREEAEERSERE